MYNTPFDVTPDKLAEEAATVQQKLGAGLATLRELDDVHYGVTAKEEVWRDGKVVLYRFRGDKTPTAKVPLLICYALVNRPYMVDLQDDRSMVKNLLALGQDVYLIDWGYTDRSDRFLTLEDYIERFIDGAVDHLREASGQDRINLLGICQGGAFSLSDSSLQPDNVRNLISMVTPGNVPADLMNLCYLTLKPWRLFVQKYVGMTDILDDRKAMEDFLRMEKWIFDSPDQAGEAFRQFIKQYYQGNGFVNGGIVIGEREVDLGFVDMPVLNIYAEQDHLVPPSASKPMKGLVGSQDYSEISFRGGDIGIYVSGRAQKEVPAAIHDWLTKRSA